VSEGPRICSYWAKVEVMTSADLSITYSTTNIIAEGLHRVVRM
jgi:hypothetical protein